MSSFDKWYEDKGLSAINDRLIALTGLRLDYVVVDNLLTDEEAEIIGGDSGIEKLSKALAKDGGKISRVTYADGDIEYRYLF